MDMKRTLLAGLVWMLGVTAQAANTIQVDATGAKPRDPVFPTVSGTNLNDSARPGFGMDVIIHGSATMTGTVSVPGLQANGGTVFFPSGYTMPRDNSQGTTVYPSSGSLWPTVSGSAFVGSSTPPGVSVPAGVDVASGTSFKGSGVAPKVEVTNTISQGDVNNASKAANMTVTDYADSASGSAGHAVATFDVGAVQTTSSTRFTVAAAGAETTFVFPRGTNWIEVRAGLASSTTEAFFVNSAAGFAKIQTGSEVGAGVDAAPYREPNLNLPVTGGTRYLSSRWGTFPLSVTYGQVQ